jgi:hypothetical protein
LVKKAAPIIFALGDLKVVSQGVREVADVTYPDRDNIEKLAQALNVDITDLLADNSGGFRGNPTLDRGT